MVNRILIRIKVVQMLYAYLLTRTEFKIDTEPDISSADKKFAHSAYVDLLLLLLEITGHNTASAVKPTSNLIDKKLRASSVGNMLAADSAVKNFIFKNNSSFAEIAPLVQTLHDRVVASSVFKEFSRKRKIELDNEVALWTVLFESTIAEDPDLKAAMRKLPGFSTVGYQMAIAKVVETLKSYYGARASYYTALKNLETSLKQSRKLYISIFVLIVRLTQARAMQLDAAKNKYLATAEDKNPNTRFVNNSFALALENSKELEAMIKEYGISWTDDITLLNSLLDAIMESSVYREYMEAESSDWEADCEFWRQVLRSVVFMSDDFTNAIEDESALWVDDLHIIGTFALKTIRIDAQSEPGHLEFLPHYKDEEDSRFGAELFEYAVKNRDLYYSYIEKYVDSSNWDSDRIAFMDSVIMICAIAEIINFPNIPLAVSLNEYIDIANAYSSARSGHFINGLLYSIVEYLKSENIIFK